VRAGLRLLEDQQKIEAVKFEALRAAIAAGLARGSAVSADRVFDRLQARYKAKLAAAE